MERTGKHIAERSIEKSGWTRGLRAGLFLFAGALALADLRGPGPNGVRDARTRVRGARARRYVTPVPVYRWGYGYGYGYGWRRGRW